MTGRQTYLLFILHGILISLVCHSYLIACHFYFTQMSLVCHSHVTRMYFYVICYVVLCHSHITHMPFVCHLYDNLMYSHVICIPFICTCVSFARHSYVIFMSLICISMSLVLLVCHLHVTRMPLVCTRMSFVCTRMLLVCVFTIYPLKPFQWPKTKLFERNILPFFKSKTQLSLEISAWVTWDTYMELISRKN